MYTEIINGYINLQVRPSLFINYVNQTTNLLRER